jgi:hypothetical protein
MRLELQRLASATEPEYDTYQRKALAPPQALSVSPQLHTKAAEVEEAEEVVVEVVEVVEAVEVVVAVVAHLGQERANNISSLLIGKV